MTIYDFTMKDANGNEVDFREYRDKVLLIVNTATRCGFTPQYVGLQMLYDKYKDKGFEVVDFPCNQFAGQAPESEKEIVEFCTTKFKTTFRQFAKVEVNGDNESPIYTHLKSQKDGVFGNAIKWNFTKFLVDREGNVIKRYPPVTPPEKIENDIINLLEK